MRSDGLWKRMTLKRAGIELIDCDHKTPPHANEGYPYIAIPQLKDGHVRLNGVRRISEEDYVRWTKKLKPMAHDVIVVRRCNSGDSAVIPRGLDCAIGQNLVVLRADGTSVAPKYLRWLLRGPDWWDQVGKFLNVGAIFDSLKCREIPEFELAIPPLSEQLEIVSILDVLDERIELLRETNVTLESIAQALFKSWFIDFDPVRAKLEGRDPERMDAETAARFPSTFDESLSGNLPHGWRFTSLNEIADVVMGLSPKGDSYNSVGIGTPLINGPVEFGEYFPVKKKWTQEATRFTYIGDLIFCVRGSTTGKFVIADDVYCIGRGVCSIRAKHNFQNFIYQTIEMGLDRLLQKTTGSVFPSLSGPDIKNFQVLMPSFDILEAFERIAKPLTERVQENQRLAQTLAELRDTLLPRLISGQLRLLESDPQLQDAA